MFHILSSRRGQSLIEYLLLVAIMGVASIGVVKILGHTLDAKFAQVTRSLNGDNSRVQTKAVTEDYYKTRSLGNFFEKSDEN